MTPEIVNIAMAIGGGLFSVVIYFLKREITRLDQSFTRFADKHDKITEALASIRVDLEGVARIKNIIVDIERNNTVFFGPNGEKTTMWKKIDELAEKIDNLSHAENLTRQTWTKKSTI